MSGLVNRSPRPAGTTAEGSGSRAAAAGGSGRSGDVGKNDHQRIDDISLALNRRVVEIIDEDPGKLRTGLENLARWRERRGGRSPGWMEEWEKLLGEGWSSVREVLLGEGQENTRLRHTAPFAGVVPEEERRRIHDAH